jgi:hypothetical protein
MDDSSEMEYESIGNNTPMRAKDLLLKCALIKPSSAIVIVKKPIK